MTIAVEMSGNDKKGRGLEDPFKDSSSEQDDGDASLLFYAYARRVHSLAFEH